MEVHRRRRDGVYVGKGPARLDVLRVLRLGCAPPLFYRCDTTCATLIHEASDVYNNGSNGGPELEDMRSVQWAIGDTRSVQQ